MISFSLASFTFGFVVGEDQITNDKKIRIMFVKKKIIFERKYVNK